MVYAIVASFVVALGVAMCAAFARAVFVLLEGDIGLRRTVAVYAMFGGVWLLAFAWMTRAH